MCVKMRVFLSFYILCACATSLTLSSAVIEQVASRSDGLLFGDTTLDRTKRQTGCGKLEWQCRDGKCINFDEKCDGVVDCDDGSDETHPLCRKSECQSNWFRCAYGACVDGTAPCNGVQECADNSDELLPRCRNETAGVPGKFKCQDGSQIPSTSQCDGVRNCPDDSDETVDACGANTCPYYLFQCEYGACVDQGSDCNGTEECADGSDETDELCNRTGTGSGTTGTRTTGTRTTGTRTTGTGTTGTRTTGTRFTAPVTAVTAPPSTGKCVLPPYPEHGTYTLGDAPDAAPGQAFDSLQLNVTCHPGFGLVGKNSAFCSDGKWISVMPKCETICKLNLNHPSVHYKCLVSGAIKGERACDSEEPVGTIVKPECNTPNYYSPMTIRRMRCGIDGTWDNIPTCIPECGKMTPLAEAYAIGGKEAKKGELPWHAGIYMKTPTSYTQICGGSIISNTLVISAAHCFWKNDTKQPDSNYAVAVGKLYRSWDDKRDDKAQKSVVQSLHIPPLFSGTANNYQSDIAILVLAKPLEYKTDVRPVCLNFDVTVERRQLQPGNMGTVAGWGYTSVDGDISEPLQVVKLPYINGGKCVEITPLSFREYITEDKICAGYINNGTALCHGDSGGGLTFPNKEYGERHYLYGIVSTAPNNSNDLCDDQTITTFTKVTHKQHEDFIKEYL